MSSKDYLYDLFINDVKGSLELWSGAGGNGGGSSGSSGTDERFKQLVEREIIELNDDSITSIGAHVFRNCDKLPSVNLPNATSIGTYAFYSCDKLVSVDFSNATSIGDYAFGYCSSLLVVILRGSTMCTLSNTNAFYSTVFYTANLGGIIFVPRALVESYKTATNWSTLFRSTYGNLILPLEDYTVDGTITGELDQSFLSGTRGFVQGIARSISNEKVTKLVARSLYFTKLRSADLPNVTIIGDAALSGNDFVTVNIPKVTSIGSSAFGSCSELESIRLPATPPSVNSNSFDSINSKCVFYIPTGSLTSYQADSTWATFISKYSFVEEDRA